MFVCVRDVEHNRKVEAVGIMARRKHFPQAHIHLPTYVHAHSDVRAHTPSARINSPAPCRLGGGWSVRLILAARV